MYWTSSYGTGADTVTIRKVKYWHNGLYFLPLCNKSTGHPNLNLTLLQSLVLLKHSTVS